MQNLYSIFSSCEFPASKVACSSKPFGMDLISYCLYSTATYTEFTSVEQQLCATITI